MRDDRGRLVEGEPLDSRESGREMRGLLSRPLVWGFLILMVGALPMAIPGGAPWDYATLLGGAMVFCAMVLYTFCVRTPGIAEVRRGCCGACGYEIEGITVEADRCRVCPECGGAWSVNAPVRCLGCGFLIRGVAEDQNSVVRCPECGEERRVMRGAVLTDEESRHAR